MKIEDGVSFNVTINFHEKLKLTAALDILDIRISYPDRVPLYGSMEELEREIRKKVMGHEKEIVRDVEVQRIAAFFGLEGHTVLLPSAGAALGIALQHFTKAGDDVVLPEPAYVFDNFVMCLADGTRTVSRIGVGSGELGPLTDRGNKKRTFITELPRFSVALEYKDNDIRLLAKEANRDSLVIYDGVNSFYDFATVASKGKDGNKLLRWTGPFADRSIRIDGTSKLFHEGFPNLAIAQISDAVYDEDPERFNKFQEFITRTSYNTRTNTDVFVMADLLHHEKFPSFLGSLKALARENSHYVQDSLKDIAEVKVDGLNIFVEVCKGDFGEEPKFIADYLREYYGIVAMNSYQYFTKSYDLPTYIRLPIIKDRAQLEGIVSKLREKLMTIKSTPRIPMDRTNEEIYV